MNNYGIICDSQTLRNVTSSWWANADFSRIENIVYTVEHELAGIIGHKTMEWLATGRGRVLTHGHMRPVPLAIWPVCATTA